jgi:hypothetical protein
MPEINPTVPGTVFHEIKPSEPVSQSSGCQQSPAEGVTYDKAPLTDLSPISKPEIAKPSSLAFQISRLYALQDDFFSRKLQDLTTRMENNFTALQEIMKEDLEQSLAVEKQEEAIVFWTTLSDAVSLVTSTVSTVVGTTLLSTQATRRLGLMLLSCGISDVTNQVMSMTGYWNWLASCFTSSKESEAKLANHMKLGHSIISKIVLLYVGALCRPHLALQNNIAQKLATFASLMIDGLAKTGEYSNHQKLAEAKKDKAAKHKAHLDQKKKVDKTGSQIKSIYDHTRKINEQMVKIFEKFISMNQTNL